MSYYKYCDGNGLKILQSLSIKVTPPSLFNDPFEFLPTANELLSIEWIKKQLKIKSVQNELRIRFKTSGIYNGTKADFTKFILDNNKYVIDFVANVYPQTQIYKCKLSAPKYSFPNTPKKDFP